MTVGKFRRVTVLTLLGLTSATIVFFIIAPVLGYPLELDQGWAMAQISIPVLTGYIGTATQFALGGHADDEAKVAPLLTWLVMGPVAIYLLGALAVLWAFWLTNRVGAPLGTGMSTQLLSTILTALLGVVTVSANIAVAQIFRKPGEVK